MKIRKSFVANSSSSSFICEICGDGDVYHDSCSLGDIGMCRCVNEHLICQEHLLHDVESDYEVPESACPICSMICYSIPEMSTYLLKEYKIPRDEVFAVIKEANKRRKKLYNEEYIKYVFDKFELTEDKMLAILKEKFKSYDEFVRYCCEN